MDVASNLDLQRMALHSWLEQKVLCYMEQILETCSASSQIDGMQTHCIDSPCLKLLFNCSKKRDGCMSLLLHIEATPRELDLRSAAQTQSCIAIMTS